MSRRSGSCHCGAVAFEVEGEIGEVLECNCSMCRRRGHLHWTVPRESFHLLRGEEALRTYTFGSGVARHLFCGTCGICSFYVPRSDPDKVSVNLRCVDGVDLASLRITPFDGADWERAHRERQRTDGQ